MSSQDVADLMYQLRKTYPASKHLVWYKWLFFPTELRKALDVEWDDHNRNHCEEHICEAFIKHTWFFQRWFFPSLWRFSKHIHYLKEINILVNRSDLREDYYALLNLDNAQRKYICDALKVLKETGLLPDAESMTPIKRRFINELLMPALIKCSHQFPLKRLYTLLSDPKKPKVSDDAKMHCILGLLRNPHPDDVFLAVKQLIEHPRFRHSSPEQALVLCAQHTHPQKMVDVILENAPESFSIDDLAKQDDPYAPAEARAMLFEKRIMVEMREMVTVKNPIEFANTLIAMRDTYGVNLEDPTFREEIWGYPKSTTIIKFRQYIRHYEHPSTIITLLDTCHKNGLKLMDYSDVLTFKQLIKGYQNTVELYNKALSDPVRRLIFLNHINVMRDKHLVVSDELIKLWLQSPISFIIDALEKVELLNQKNFDHLLLIPSLAGKYCDLILELHKSPKLLTNALLPIVLNSIDDNAKPKEIERRYEWLKTRIIPQLHFLMRIIQRCKQFPSDTFDITISRLPLDKIFTCLFSGIKASKDVVLVIDYLMKYTDENIHFQHILAVIKALNLSESNGYLKERRFLISVVRALHTAKLLSPPHLAFFLTGFDSDTGRLTCEHVLASFNRKKWLTLQNLAFLGELFSHNCHFNAVKASALSAIIQFEPDLFSSPKAFKTVVALGSCTHNVYIFELIEALARQGLLTRKSLTYVSEQASRFNPAQVPIQEIVDLIAIEKMFNKTVNKPDTQDCFGRFFGVKTVTKPDGSVFKALNRATGDVRAVDHILSFLKPKVSDGLNLPPSTNLSHS